MIRRSLTLTAVALATLSFGALGADPPGVCSVDKTQVELLVSKDAVQFEDSNVDALLAFDVVVSTGVDSDSVAIAVTHPIGVSAFIVPATVFLVPECLLVKAIPVAVVTVDTFIAFGQGHLDLRKEVFRAGPDVAIQGDAVKFKG